MHLQPTIQLSTTTPAQSCCPSQNLRTGARFLQFYHNIQDVKLLTHYKVLNKRSKSPFSTSKCKVHRYLGYGSELNASVLCLNTVETMFFTIYLNLVHIAVRFRQTFAKLNYVNQLSPLSANLHGVWTQSKDKRER